MVEGSDDLSSDKEAEMTEQRKETMSSAQTPDRQPARVPQDAANRTTKRPAEDLPLWEPDEDDEEALLLAAMAADDPLPKTVQRPTEGIPKTTPTSSEKASSQAGGMNEGMMAALAKLRKA